MKPLGTFLLAVLSLLSVAAPVRAADIFYVESSPSAWVGQGRTLNYSTVTTHRYFEQGAYTNAVTLFGGPYDVTIVGPNMSLPTVGSYENASRWPFMGTGPGLDFSGDGRGNNTLSGRFDVLQADYSPAGAVQSFALNFVQYDERNTQRWNRGYVRFNSTIPVPEPSGMVLLTAASILVLRRRRAM